MNILNIIAGLASIVGLFFAGYVIKNKYIDNNSVRKNTQIIENSDNNQQAGRDINNDKYSKNR